MNCLKPALTAVIFALLASASLSAEETGQEEKPLVIFAASSLTDVLAAQASVWIKSAGKQHPKLSFGASATMARQIQMGAPADLYISANPVWMQILTKSGKANKATALISNQLVLVVPIGDKPVNAFEPTVASFHELLTGRRLAIADPALAPAGQYAKAYLSGTGLWATLATRLAYAPNVRQALRLAESGGLPAFVYESDALASARVRIVYIVPPMAIPPIVYQAATLKPESPDARAFLAYLASEAAGSLWEKYGFHKIASN